MVVTARRSYLGGRPGSAGQLSIRTHHQCTCKRLCQMNTTCFDCGGITSSSILTLQSLPMQCYFGRLPSLTTTSILSAASEGSKGAMRPHSARPSLHSTPWGARPSSTGRRPVPRATPRPTRRLVQPARQPVDLPPWGGSRSNGPEPRRINTLAAARRLSSSSEAPPEAAKEQRWQRSKSAAASESAAVQVRNLARTALASRGCAQADGVSFHRPNTGKWVLIGFTWDAVGCAHELVGIPRMPHTGSCSNFWCRLRRRLWQPPTRR